MGELRTGSAQPGQTKTHTTTATADTARPSGVTKGREMSTSPIARNAVRGNTHPPALIKSAVVLSLGVLRTYAANMARLHTRACMCPILGQDNKIEEKKRTQRAKRTRPIPRRPPFLSPAFRRKRPYGGVREGEGGSSVLRFWIAPA